MNVKIPYFKHFTSLANKVYFRAIAVLVSGQAIGQVIALALLPFLTRVYTPDEFSVLAQFLAVVMILAPVALLRMELAVPIAESDEEVADILVLSVLYFLLFILILSSVFGFWYEGIWGVLGRNSTEITVALFLPAVLLMGVNNLLQSYAVREKAFVSLAIARVFQSVGAGGSQLVLGVVGVGAIGLVGGQLLGILASLVVVLILLPVMSVYKGWGFSLSRIKGVAKQYANFPRYSVVDSLFNSLSIQLPIILISIWLLGPEAGYLLLVIRVMQAPVGLVGRSVAQVFLSRAPDEYRDSNLDTFTLETFKGLLVTGLGPLLCIAIVAPLLFPIVFGGQWERAGELVSWMAPWCILQYLASPISMVMHVTGNQRALLFLTVLGFIVRLSFVVVSYFYWQSVLSEMYLVSGFVYYMICLLVFSRYAGVTVSGMVEVGRQSARYIVPWVVLGAFANVGLRFL